MLVPTISFDLIRVVCSLRISLGHIKAFINLLTLQKWTCGRAVIRTMGLSIKRTMEHHKKDLITETDLPPFVAKTYGLPCPIL